MTLNDDKFWEIVNGALPESTVTNFVMICEVNDSDQPQLRIVTSGLVTPWLAQGMLHFGLSMVESMKEDNL